MKRSPHRIEFEGCAAAIAMFIFCFVVTMPGWSALIIAYWLTH